MRESALGEEMARLSRAGIRSEDFACVVDMRIVDHKWGVRATGAETKWKCELTGGEAAPTLNELLPG